MDLPEIWFYKCAYLTLFSTNCGSFSYVTAKIQRIMYSCKPKNAHPQPPNFITWSHKGAKTLQKDSWVFAQNSIGHFPSTSNPNGF